jgi:hypothetical protein
MKGESQSMYKAKTYSAAGATSPLASTTISRRDPTENDVQIEILFCGICHSDLHQVRNEWSGVMPTVYPPVILEAALSISRRSSVVSSSAAAPMFYSRRYPEHIAAMSNRLKGEGVQSMEIKKAGSQASRKGPAEYFNGTVRVDPLFDAPDPARVLGASVTFEPGAHCMAHSPAGADSDRDVWVRPRATLGRSDRGDTAWGCDLVLARREALARGSANHADDPHRYGRKAPWEEHRLDGEGHERTVHRKE